MKTLAIPLLLTSSVIAHDTGVALQDTQERTRLALESVREWLKIDAGLRIVLCDGSGFDFTAQVAQDFPQAAIECLHFDNDQERVRQYGRGYGEGEIVRHALAHSRFIAEAGCFAKCSSKLWVENYPAILAHWNGQMLFKGVFLHVFSPFKTTEFAYIDTRFYIASCASYHRYFEDAHTRIDRERGHGLEECFRDVVLKQQLTGVLTGCPPVIAGVGGGTGAYYKNPLKRQLKEKLRLRLARMNRKFANMF